MKFSVFIFPSLPMLFNSLTFVNISGVTTVKKASDYLITSHLQLSRGISSIEASSMRTTLCQYFPYTKSDRLQGKIKTEWTQKLNIIVILL